LRADGANWIFFARTSKGTHMASRSPTSLQLIGIALAFIGLGLEYWAYQLSGSLSSQISSMVTGADTDVVIMCYIAGAVSFILGIYFITRK
jgi:hypothetical protein